MRAALEPIQLEFFDFKEQSFQRASHLQLRQELFILSFNILALVLDFVVRIKKAHQTFRNRFDRKRRNKREEGRGRIDRWGLVQEGET